MVSKTKNLSHGFSVLQLQKETRKTCGFAEHRLRVGKLTRRMILWAID